MNRTTLFYLVCGVAAIYLMAGCAYRSIQMAQASTEAEIQIRVEPHYLSRCFDVQLRLTKTIDGLNLDSLAIADPELRDSLVQLYAKHFSVPRIFLHHQSFDSLGTSVTIMVPPGTYSAQLKEVPGKRCITTGTPPYMVFGIAARCDRRSVVVLGLSSGVEPDGFQWQPGTE